MGLRDAGLFGIHAATKAENMGKMVNVITDQLHRAAAESPSQAELSRAKAQLKAGLLMSLESSGARTEQLARQILAFGKPLSVDELIARVDGVSAQNVRQFAEHLLTGARPACATVGSKTPPETIGEFAANFS